MKLLFICTHNACRSIVAEAVTRRIAGDRIAVASAGSAPAGQLHPRTLEFLSREGYDPAGFASQSWDELEDFRPDAVITVCDSAAGETCPVWFGDAVRAHWALPDPSRIDGTPEEVRAAFDRIAGTLTRRIQALLSAESPVSAEQLKRTLDGLSGT